MSRKPKFQFICLLLMAGIFFSAAHAAAAKAENRLFMKEFSQFVLGNINSEAPVRAKIRTYLKENEAQVREGFGSRPDLIFRLYRELGLERMNCIRGRYYEDFASSLNNEERHLFYENTQRLDWWVLMIAVEEADSLGIRKASPPLNFRQPADMPFNLSKTMREELAPFAEVSLTHEDAKGLSYNSLPCE